jgi:hypothetical protein
MFPFVQITICPTCARQKFIDCRGCAGSGRDDKGSTCNECKGKGRLPCWNCEKVGYINV